MPNKKTHVVVGGLAGASYSIAKTPDPDIFSVAGGTAAGMFGGALPDLMEPASSPNHRAFGHSLLLGGAIAVAAKRLEESGWDDYCLEQAAYHRDLHLGAGRDEDRIGHLLAEA